MDESSFVMQPGKAKNVNDVMDHIASLEKAALHRIRTLGKAPLEDDLMRNARLNMIDPTGEK